MRRETTFKLKLFILAAAAPCWLWTWATAEAQADPQKVNIYTAGRAGVTQKMRELAKYPTAEEVRKHLDGAEQALNRAVHVRAAHIPDAKGDLVDKYIQLALGKHQAHAHCA